ncbi:MAG: hypothetical protein Q9224_000637 [Gallowayella concinna]
MKVWGSSAIIDYLLETYDKDNELRYTSGHEKFLQKSWMAMQIKKGLQSAIDRYGNEYLKTSGKPYLIGDECTYADLAFQTWHWSLIYPPQFMGAGFIDEWKQDFPAAWAWYERIQARPAVTKVFNDRLKTMKASKH